jgi:hypothetical protein
MIDKPVGCVLQRALVYTSPASRAAGARPLRRQTQTSLEGWGPTRSLYGYSMSTRIKSNQLARGPDPRLNCFGPGNLRRRGPCVQPHTSVYRGLNARAGRWRPLGCRKEGSGSQVRGSSHEETRPVDLRQLVLSLLYERSRASAGRDWEALLVKQELRPSLSGGRQLPG